MASRAHRPRRAATALLALLVTAAACGRHRSSEAISRLGASCILIVLDAAAAGHVGAYGSVRSTTPKIDHLADDGALFTHAYSQASSTVVSVPSFLSGLYPQTISALRRAGEDGRPFAFVQPGLDPERTSWWTRWRRGPRPQLIAQAFHAAGFRTAAFSENPIVGPAIGLDAGFDVFQEINPLGVRATGSVELMTRAIGWIEANRDARTFVYLHLLRPHTPYLPPPPIPLRFRPRTYEGVLTADVPTVEAIDRGARSVTPEDVDFIASQYDANLFYGDLLIGQLVQVLKRIGTLDRTVLVITGDHGEAFGQHGRFLHNSTLYDEMIHVPLVIRLPPDVAPRGTRVTVPVGLVDLFPTLVDLFSLEDGRVARTDGVSLVPLLENPAARLPSRLIFAQRLSTVAAMSAELKYIVDLGGPPGRERLREELYALAADPGEQRDVAAARPADVAAMRQAVTRFVGVQASVWGVEVAAPSLSQEKQDQLRALGYVH